MSVKRLDDPAVLVGRFSRLVSEKRFADALGVLSQGLTQHPDAKDAYGHPLFRKEIIRLLLQQGDFNGAVQYVPETNEDWHFILFARACHARGLTSEAVSWWRRIPPTSRDFQESLSNLQRVGEPVDPAIGRHAPRRLNHLARHLGCASYLEIGVHDGKTLLHVTCEHRVGVDPDFRFDIEDHRESTLELYNETSDTFFQRDSSGVYFDLIFLDGLHTFEQTYRDFLNSLAHSHRRTVWLIDDTRPTSVYSSVRDRSVAMRARAEQGHENQAWHGDVFKMIFALHDFHFGFDYRTLMGSGNGQTLIWPSKRFPRAPRFNDFERISRLTYFDLLENEDVLRCVPEADGLTACLDAMTAQDDDGMRGRDAGVL